MASCLIVVVVVMDFCATVLTWNEASVVEADVNRHVLQRLARLIHRVERGEDVEELALALGSL